MKIALLTTDIREHLREYLRPKPGFGAAPEALLEGFAALPVEAEVHVISCVRRPVESPAKLAENIWYHSLIVEKRGWMTTGYQGCIRAVREKLREIQPDIVHGQGTERDCAITAVKSGFPNVVTIHGNMAELARLFRARLFSYGWLNARLETYTLRRAGGVLCNSAYTESLVRPRARRTWRVPNALRAAFFQPIPDTPREQLPRIVNIGVISPRKRQAEILDLATQLHARGVKVMFEFVGMCPRDTYGKGIYARLAQAEKEGFARWCGTMNAEELVAHLDRASAVLHFPSEEAFGLVVGEALARDLKFFGANLGGIGDIAGGGESVELFDAADWSGLGAAIERWVQAGAPRAVGAAKVMAERYHPRTIAERHLAIYREVLQSRS